MNKHLKEIQGEQPIDQLNKEIKKQTKKPKTYFCLYVFFRSNHIKGTLKPLPKAGTTL